MIRKVVYYLTHWETWHWFAKYIIIGPAWMWLCIKSRSLWFFTPSNPGIEFGGFVGETKSEIYKRLPAGSYPKSIFVTPKHSPDEIDHALAASGLKYPLAVKPNVGMMGLMFRKIESRQQLKQYHEVIPGDYIIQEFIEYPIEVSVFYYRMPDEAKGHITGFIRKEFMEVTGNGVSTLKDLILKYPRAQFRLNELFSKHERKLNNVIGNGERFILSDALNLSRGGQLINLDHEKDERLLHLFDQLSHHADFYYGRYDIRCNSIEELKEGKNFSILEFNGCGGEAHHVYTGYSFFEACKILIDHWNVLYEISRKHKIKPWKFSDGYSFLRNAQKYFDQLKYIDHHLELEPAIEKAYQDFISVKDFPCIAAKTALAKDQVRVMVCDHIACPKDDWAITKFIHDFVDEYRSSEKMYTSAAVIFTGPTECSEEYFDSMMWQRLQAISDLDARDHDWRQDISKDPASEHFSFCVKEEPFYIVGLHPGSSRRSRRFQYPAIVFNPHDQFEKLRESNKYAAMKKAVRKRDEVFSGSVNPMLSDFGERSEAHQYSGRVYDENWKCTFKSNHGNY